MEYVSTRGEAPIAGFLDVLLNGLAPDGGLYVPREWPRLNKDEIASFADRPYFEVAADLVGRFSGDEIAPPALREMCSSAYASFRHPAVAPLVQLDVNRWVLELFHGPTFAFKDLAMQLLARIMDHALAQRGRRATIVVATSGDTGGSAIEAFRGAANIDLFVLFPEGRVSPVQQLQMTTAQERNIFPMAVAGSFDDCQALVKALFSLEGFRDRVSLAAVNSINWARIVAQTTYYFTASVALGGPERSVAFCVPTGNFGDVFAGHVASLMGLPIGQLIVATNSNDILARAISTGRYEMRQVVPTASPSMDIQVSSNFERLLWEASGGDSDAVRIAMGRLKQNGSFDIDADALARITENFVAGSANEMEMQEAMRDNVGNSQYLADPHTAVALAVAGRLKPTTEPLITLATAHPSKFPDAVETATGKRPTAPPEIAALATREARLAVIDNNLVELKNYVLEHTRASCQEA